MMSSIASQSMANSENQVQQAMNFKLMKNSMNDAEAQAFTMINDMMEANPAPSNHKIDVMA